MKKITMMFLAAVMCVGLAACGGPDYSSRTIDYLGNDFSWDMTAEDAEAYIEENAVVSNRIETEEHEDYTIISDDHYIFRFDSEGTMEFAKIRDTGSYQDIFDLLKQEYGDPDEEKDDSYYWYGTMDGRNAYMCLFEGGSVNYIEFAPED